MFINILLPYKEKFTKNKASSVSITVKNNLEYSKHKEKVRVFGQYVDEPMFTKNFIGVKKSLNIFKSKNKMIADEMCKQVKQSNEKNIIEVHNRPYLIQKIKSQIKPIDKVTLFFHNNPLEMKGSKTISERKKLLLELDKIYCVSEYVKKNFLKGISNDHNKVKILHNGVIRKINAFPKKEKEIIFVGRIVKDKGVHLFVDAIRDNYNLFDKWKFKIIGSPKLGVNKYDNFSFEIKNKFENIGIRANMIGFINSDDLNIIMQKASIIVIPSIWEEPFGLVAAEAMSNGLAIIASNRGGLPEIIKKNGILINDINHEKISRQLKKLTSNNKLLKQFQKKSWNNFILKSDKISKILDKHRDDLFFKN
ncbi:MAG: hypothetical protein CMN44_01040 [SAR116 cluster bacterium]|nr:hypothetical protein [SAR116 cluster bacterium]RPH11804.1 MAG: glycosyltransferase [Alphaproteobacteria bacterium TMED54]